MTVDEIELLKKFSALQVALLTRRKQTTTRGDELPEKTNHTNFLSRSSTSHLATSSRRRRSRCKMTIKEELGPIIMMMIKMDVKSSQTL